MGWLNDLDLDLSIYAHTHLIPFPLDPHVPLDQALPGQEVRLQTVEFLGGLGWREASQATQMCGTRCR